MEWCPDDIGVDQNIGINEKGFSAYYRRTYLLYAGLPLLAKGRDHPLEDPDVLCQVQRSSVVVLFLSKNPQSLPLPRSGRSEETESFSSRLLRYAIAMVWSKLIPPIGVLSAVVVKNYMLKYRPFSIYFTCQFTFMAISHSLDPTSLPTVGTIKERRFGV